ncbi:MAG TPA: type II toxin-antitoxin system prevent-host-death family antitoxin [Terriglobales bacterium]|nr:type II toxin-antitoxin system prevent-host-death family antitoxin [Terriglobales bacterium]
MYTVHQTKTNLSKILREVTEQRKEVVIARGNEPIAKIVPIDKKVQRKVGTMKGKLVVEDSFFAPLSDEELKDWGIE